MYLGLTLREGLQALYYKIEFVWLGLLFFKMCSLLFRLAEQQHPRKSTDVNCHGIFYCP